MVLLQLHLDQEKCVDKDLSMRSNACRHTIWVFQSVIKEQRREIE